MRKLILLALSVAAWGADEKAKEPAIPQPIAEIKLTNGTVWRNVTIIRYDRQTVTLKSSAGTGPLQYSMIPEPLRTTMLAERDKALAATRIADEQRASAAAARQKKFSGQVFVATRGGESKKLGDVKVMAFPLNSLSAFDTNSGPVYLPKPIATATTDADGKFSVAVPPEAQIFLFAESSRFIGGRTGTEYYQWHVAESEFGDPSKALLSNGNMATKTFEVRVEQ